MKFILASASPRRKELLAQAGFTFDIVPSSIKEVITKTVPSEIVMELAEQKARDVYDSCKTKDCVVIGADTIVAYQDEILGKPEDEEDAYNMLAMLANRTHQVYTGVSLIINRDEHTHVNTFYECTDVTFCPIHPNDIRAYVESGDPMDKAGSYGIQSIFAVHVKEIRGEYNNVVGLPICRLYQ